MEERQKEWEEFEVTKKAHDNKLKEKKTQLVEADKKGDSELDKLKKEVEDLEKEAAELKTKEDDLRKKEKVPK